MPSQLTPHQAANLAWAIDARATKIAHELFEESPNIATATAIAILVQVVARLEQPYAELVIRELPDTVRCGIEDLR